LRLAALARFASYAGRGINLFYTATGAVLSRETA
jgi:hypothetical protein